MEYEFTTNVNPDTELLAEMLQAEYQNVLASDTALVDKRTLLKLAWYRVAERAKELRA